MEKVTLLPQYSQGAAALVAPALPACDREQLIDTCQGMIKECPKTTSAAPHSTFSERCLCLNSLTLRGNHSWHLKYEMERAPGILVLSTALFAAAGCSGTDSKQHLCTEHNSCQYLQLNNRAASLPEDVLEKTAQQNRGRLEEGNTFLSLENFQLI